jgi:tRNA-dihydrouridine synthase 3
MAEINQTDSSGAGSAAQDNLAALTDKATIFEVSPVTPSKRKMDTADDEKPARKDHFDGRNKGTAPIKSEYLIPVTQDNPSEGPRENGDAADDDAAEAFHHKDRQPDSHNKKQKKRDKNQGQNKARKFGSSRDEVGLCSTRAQRNEFSPTECKFGDKCKFEHDLRRYLKDRKREDLTTFGSLCPVFQVRGRCSAGWKCRFVGSHSKEVDHEDGRKELVLVEDGSRVNSTVNEASAEDNEAGVVNTIDMGDRIRLTRRNFDTPKTQAYLDWMINSSEEPHEQGHRKNHGEEIVLRNSSSPEPNGTDDGTTSQRADHRAGFTDARLLPSEKRRLYFGPETPILAPLTTQGNLPFRRLCTSLGATFTYSEMAMSMPLLQGQKSEWALIKAHESDLHPPTFTAKDSSNIVFDYDQSKDLRFSAQIAANKPWLACKATEALTTLLPQGLRCVDLNVGCPIDLVYREGAGSALMDSPHKLEKMLRGMNYVSGATPVTVKIRTGTRDKQPTAQKLVDRLVLGSDHHHQGSDPCGVAAITLHGRSRQQRYTRSADWDYITETASLIKNLNAKADVQADTINEPDERYQANTHKGAKNSKVYFIGNGDVYSHVHYNDHITHSGVDGVMVARGALIKPWVFEEIATNQYLDKSSSERLRYIEQFCRNGLEAWGSDEIGVGQTRRFLLEWLSFACRYVPIGLLEVLPPNIQDRPPRFRGRDELETLMASDNYRDWIKIRYVVTLSRWWRILLTWVIVRCSWVLRTRTSGLSQSIRVMLMILKLRDKL